jgi:hypothetical protein
LNELLQPLTAGVHVSQDITLAIVQAAELLAAKQLDVSIKNGKWSLEIMCC